MQGGELKASKLTDEQMLRMLQGRELFQRFMHFPVDPGICAILRGCLQYEPGGRATSRALLAMVRDMQRSPVPEGVREAYHLR